jgi:hypothetical protein
MEHRITGYLMCSRHFVRRVVCQLPYAVYRIKAARARGTVAAGSDKL